MVVLRRIYYEFEDEYGEPQIYIFEYTHRHLIADILVKPFWKLAWKLNAPWNVIKFFARAYYRILGINKQFRWLK